MSKPIGIFIADDHSIIVAGLNALFSASSNFRVKGYANSGTEMMHEMRVVAPEILLLDLNMPGVKGVDTVAELRKEFPALKIVILTANMDVAMAQLLLGAGADGYVIKNDDGDELLRALQFVMAGERYLSAGLRTPQADADMLNPLTPRELELLALIGDGRSNAQIAQTLGITVSTTRKHRENLRRKLNAHNGAQLAALAVVSGVRKQSS